jgi:hypothetical protein
MQCCKLMFCQWIVCVCRIKYSRRCRLKHKNVMSNVTCSQLYELRIRYRECVAFVHINVALSVLLKLALWKKVVKILIMSGVSESEEDCLERKVLFTEVIDETRRLANHSYILLSSRLSICSVFRRICIVIIAERYFVECSNK